MLSEWLQKKCKGDRRAVAPCIHISTATWAETDFKRSSHCHAHAHTKKLTTALRKLCLLHQTNSIPLQTLVLCNEPQLYSVVSFFSFSLVKKQNKKKNKPNVTFKVEMHSATAWLKTTHIFSAQKQLRVNEIAAFVCRSWCLLLWLCQHSNYFRVRACFRPEKKRVSNMSMKLFGNKLQDNMLLCVICQPENGSWSPTVNLKWGGMWRVQLFTTINHHPCVTGSECEGRMQRKDVTHPAM